MKPTTGMNKSGLALNKSQISTGLKHQIFV